MTHRYLILFAVAFAMVTGCACNSGTKTTPKNYAYIYNGKKINLNPSKEIFAVQHNSNKESTSLADNWKKQNILRDRLSDLPIPVKANLIIYRIKDLPKQAEKTDILFEKLKKQTQKANLVFQPVFEQGQALLIPTQNILVGFKTDTDLKQAVKVFEPVKEESGIIDIRNTRKNIFTLTITNPADGRCYDVCQAISKIGAVDFAEPDHLVIMP